MKAGVKFALLTVVLSFGMFGLGWLPTRRLAGADSLSSMAVGIGVSLIGSWIGAVPIALMTDKTTGANVGQVVLASGLLRFVVVLALALSIGLSGLVDRATFLVWVAIAYMVLLAADTHYALRAGSAKHRSEG